MNMIEDRMRGLKMRVPKHGLRIKLIPTDEELEECRQLGKEIAEILMGRVATSKVLELADL